MLNKQKIFIIILIIIITIPAIFINSAMGYMPLIFILLLVLFSYIYSFVCLKSFKINIDSENLKEYERLSEADYTINIKNKWRFVLPKVSFSITLEGEEGNMVKEYQYDFILNPKEEKELGVKIEFPHIGKFKIIISKIRFYGFINILYLWKNTKWHEEIFIQPKTYSIEGYEIHTLNPVFSVDYNVVHKTKGGEFSDVREYTYGDPMKNIHWKLSAHSNSLISKIIDTDAISGISVYLDFSSNESLDYETKAEIYDCIVETAYSIGIYALNKDYGISFVYPLQNNATYYVPKSLEEIKELVHMVPSLSMREGYSLELLISEYLNTMISFDNIIVIATKISNQLINLLIDCRDMGKFPILFIVNPDSENQNMEDELMNNLIKSGMKYFVISTAKDAAVSLGGLQ